MRNHGWLVAVGLFALCGCSTDTTGGTQDKGKKPAAKPAISKAELLPTGRVAPLGLAHDDQYIYWTHGSSKGGDILRGSPDGKQMAYLAREEPTTALITLDADHVYFAVEEGDVHGLLRVDKAGGVKEILGRIEDAAGGIAAYGGVAYYTLPKLGKVVSIAPPPPPDPKEAKAKKASKEPVVQKDPIVVLATGQVKPREIAADVANLYWIAGEPGAKDNRIMKMPRAGGEPTVVADNQWGPVAIAIDDVSVYWAMPGTAGDALRSAHKSGGEVKEIAKGLGAVKRIRSDGTHVYVAAGKTISRVPVGGGEIEKVVEPSIAPDAKPEEKFDVTGLEVAADWVYWPDYTNGRIYRAAKNPK